MQSQVTEQPIEHSYKNSPISYHFAAMLSGHKWSCFCVFTTHYPLRKDRARTLMTQFFNELSSRLGRAPRLFWVAEKAPLKENFHIHALVCLDMDVAISCKIVEDTWKRVSKAGGAQKLNISYVKPYTSVRNGGCHYVSKQLNPWVGEIDWDIYLQNF